MAELENKCPCCTPIEAIGWEHITTDNAEQCEECLANDIKESEYGKDADH